MLGGLALSLEVPLFEPGAGSSLDAPIAVAALLALAGYLVAGVESRAIATAVIGGRVEGRPLRLRASISLARRRFLKVLGASVIVGFTAGLLGIAIQVPIGIALGNVEEINYGLSLLIGTLVAAPFAYVTAGIVLGEVGVFEAITRSFRLARARKRLALVVALFGVLSQFIVLFGISIGGDVVLRILDGTGIGEVFPAALAIPVAAALAFAFGTLLFLVEAITAAPAVYAFVALTHYTHGLQAGRDAPAGGTRVWDPWLTPGLAIAALVGFLALIAAVTDLPA
jgi:putative flippase GtrA